MDEIEKKLWAETYAAEYTATRLRQANTPYVPYSGADWQLIETAEKQALAAAHKALDNYLSAKLEDIR